MVGIDLGGTKTTAALVDPDGQVLGRVSLATPALDGPAAVLDAAAVAATAVVEQSGGAPGTTRGVGAVGIGTAGLVDVSTGTIVSATDVLPGWPGTPVGTGLTDRLGRRWGRPVRVVVQNDVDAHGAGEAWLGAGAGCTALLLVAVGTGVGAAVVLDGTPRRGAHGAGGEIGHVPTPGAGGRLCSCGRPGHLEAVAAGPAVARRYLELTGDPVDARTVAARAGVGDPAAAEVVREAGNALGRAIAGQVTVLDPDLVVLGGGFAGAGPLWWEAVESTLRGELIDVLSGVALLPAQLGADAALLGAARSVLAGAEIDE